MYAHRVLWMSKLSVYSFEIPAVRGCSAASVAVRWLLPSSGHNLEIRRLERASIDRNSVLSSTFTHCVLLVATSTVARETLAALGKNLCGTQNIVRGSCSRNCQALDINTSAIVFVVNNAAPKWSDTCFSAKFEAHRTKFTEMDLLCVSP